MVLQSQGKSKGETIKSRKEADQRPLFWSSLLIRPPMQNSPFTSAPSSRAYIQAGTGRQTQVMEDFVVNVIREISASSLGKVDTIVRTRRLSPKLRLAQGKLRDAATAHRIIQRQPINPECLLEKQIHPQLLSHYPNLSSGGFSSFPVGHSSRHLLQ